MTDSTISIVTPWLNCRELYRNYSLAVQGADEIIVIDNGSDPPLSLIPHRVLRSESNMGYSAANNWGLREAGSDAVLFLNNDIRVASRPVSHMVDSGWLDNIRQALRPGRLVGASLLQNLDSAIGARGFPYLDGWCLAGMRDDLLALGGWDEGYEEPAYFSDCDLCGRARSVGMRLVQVPVGLIHLGNYTTRGMNVSAVSGRNRAKYKARMTELFAPA